MPSGYVLSERPAPLFIMQGLNGGERVGCGGGGLLRVTELGPFFLSTPR